MEVAFVKSTQDNQATAGNEALSIEKSCAVFVSLSDETISEIEIQN